MSKHIRFFYIYLLLFSLNISFLNAQTNFASEDELKKEAAKLFEEDEFEKAAPLYSQLLSNYLKDANYNYRLGVCLLFTSEDKEQVLKYLEFAASKPNIEKEVHYYLGRAYHLNYMFDEAIAEYHAYVKVASAKNVEKFQVHRQAEMCVNGKKLLNNLSDLVVIDKKDMNKDDFFRAYDISGIGGKLLVKPDEKEFKTSIDKRKKEQSIIYLAKDKSQIYFSSYGLDPINGKDIYVIKKTESGEWGKPLAIGNTVNTKYDEDFPFLHPNGKVLYFSSKGQNSMGGYDIFKSKFNETTNAWSVPENLGFPVNTPDDDILYVTDSAEKEAYFSSARFSKSREISVYHINVDRKPIDLVIVKGNVKKNRNNQALDVKITVKNLATNTIQGIYNSSAVDGSYSLDLPNGGSFSFTVESAAFPTQTDVVVVPVQYKFKPMKQEISFDLVTGSLKILNNFNETSEDENYLLALNYIKNKSKMDVSIVDMTQLDTLKQEIAKELATSNQIKKDTVLSDKKLSNDDIVKIAYEDAKDVDVEAKEMRKQADIALSLANQKNELAQNKVKESSAFMAEAQGTVDVAKKEELFDKSESASAEAKQLNLETVIAYNLAKKLDANAFKKQEEADIFQEYAKSLQASVKTGNTAVALAKVEEQERKLEELSQANAGTSSISNSLKAEAESKQRELSKVIATNTEIKQEIVDNETVVGNLRSDLAKTKNEELKQGLINQIAELNQENSDKKVEITQNDEKVAKLQKEYNGILNETALINTVINQSKTGSSEIASASIVAIDKNKLEQQVNNIATKNAGIKNDVAVTPSTITSKESSKKSQPLISEKGLAKPVNQDSSVDLKFVKKTDIVGQDNKIETKSEIPSDVKNNSVKLGDKQVVEESTGAKTTIVSNLGNSNATNAPSEITQPELASNSEIKQSIISNEAEGRTSVITESSIPEKSTETIMPNTTPKGVNTTIGNPIITEPAQQSTIAANTKNETKSDSFINETPGVATVTLPSKPTTSQVEIKRNTPTNVNNSTPLVVPDLVAASNKPTKQISEPLDIVPSVPKTESKTISENQQESVLPEKTAVASNTTTVIEEADKSKLLNSSSEINNSKTKGESFAAINKKKETEYVVADKISDPVNREIAKTEVLQKWAKAIDDDIVILQQQYDTTRDNTKKELILNQLNEARTNSNEKHTMANIGKQSVEELKQQSVTSTTTEGSTKETAPTVKSTVSKSSTPVVAANKPSTSPVVQSTVSKPTTPTPVVAITKPTSTPVVKQSEFKPSATIITSAKPTTPSFVESPLPKSIAKVLPETSAIETSENRPLSIDTAAKTSTLVTNKAGLLTKLSSTVVASTSKDTVDKLLSKINKANEADLIVAEKIKNKKDRVSAKNAVLKMWAEEINSHVVELQKEYWTETDSQKKILLANQIASAEKISKEKYTPSLVSQGQQKNQQQQTNTTLSLRSDELFEQKSFPVYSAEKPIPINNKLPEGLIYKVQIGAFRKPIPQNLFTGMTPITGETTPQGFIRYTAGIFKNYATADNVKIQIKKLGYKDAFVVAFLNGKRISIKEASAISGEGITEKSDITSTNIADLQKQFTNISNGKKSQSITEEAKRASFVTESVKSVGGLFYTVQVGVFANNIFSSKLFNVQPLYTETAPNGNVRYNVGVYDNLTTAAEAKFMTIDVGLKDSYVTAYFNGKRVSMKEAAIQHELNGDKVFSTDPNINILPYFGLPKKTNTLDKIVAEKKSQQNLNLKTEIPLDKNALSIPDSSGKVVSSTIGKQLENSSGKIIAPTFASDIVFKIQLGAFKNEVPLEIVNQFLKISKLGVENHKDLNGLTIFTAGDFKTYGEASKIKQEVIFNNFKDAFIVAYRNGKKIAIGEAKIEY